MMSYYVLRHHILQKVCAGHKITTPNEGNYLGKSIAVTFIHKPILWGGFYNAFHWRGYRGSWTRVLENDISYTRGQNFHLETSLWRVP